LYEFSRLNHAVIANAPREWLREWQIWAWKCESCDWQRGSDSVAPGEAITDEPTPKELERDAALAREALNGTVYKHPWPIVHNADVILLETGRRHIIATRREDSFLFGVHEIIFAARKSLRQCERDGCSEIFVAWRRKAFCSDQCAQSARQQQSRDQRSRKKLIKEGATEAEADVIMQRKRAERAAKHNARLEREAGYDPDRPRQPLVDPEIVRIKNFKTGVGYLTMNKSDFDPQKHELFEEQAKPKAAAHGRRQAEVSASKTRQVEVCGARWSEVDLTRGLWQRLRYVGNSPRSRALIWLSPLESHPPTTKS